MGAEKRTEYVICCDGADCYHIEAACWKTRKEAEADAIKQGWVKYGRRLFCRSCVLEADREGRTVRSIRTR